MEDHCSTEVHDSNRLTANQEIPETTNSVDVLKAMGEPRDYPRSCKSQLLVVKLRKYLFEVRITSHGNKIDEFVEDNYGVFEAVKEVVAHVCGCHPM